MQYQLGTNSDQTVVSGNLTLLGTLNITDAGGFTNATYTLFTYGGTLTYNGLTIGTTPSSNFTYAVSTNTPGQVTLIVGLPDPFAAWQWQYFGCTNCPQADPGADPLGKGMTNTNQFLAGVNPTNSVSLLRITSVVETGNDVLVTWTTAGVRTNALQAAVGDGTGGYSNNFSDISGPIIIPSAGDATTNFPDSGGATNGPARYYRIRLVP